MHKHGGDIYNNVNCIDFSANINFLGMPQEVVEAVHDSVEKCVYYPDVEMTDLKNALSKRENCPVNKIICGNGAAELIFALTAAVKPECAIVFAPSFYEYEQALKFNNTKIVEIKLDEENNFSLTKEKQESVLAAIDDDTDMIFLCNPNNPTGVLTEREFIQEILKRCEETDTIFVVDECFLDFIEEKNKYSVADLVLKSNNLFVLKAFTKIFAMPGLRLGYGLCGNESLMRRIREGIQPWNVSVVAQAAGCVAAKCTEFEIKTRKLLATEKLYLISELKKLDIKLYGYAANYIFFKADVKLGEKLRQKNIVIRDCSNYRSLSNGYYRIAVKNHEDNVKLINALKMCREE